MNGCIFCAIIRGEIPASVVLEDDLVIGFLDRSPLIKGHVLVAPRAHVADLDVLPADLIEPLFAAVQRVGRVFPKVLGSDGSFTGINNRVSQSVPHLHVHVVPRKEGDGLFSQKMVWTRKRYAEGEAAQLAARLKEAIAAS